MGEQKVSCCVLKGVGGKACLEEDDGGVVEVEEGEACGEEEPLDC